VSPPPPLPPPPPKKDVAPKPPPIALIEDKLEAVPLFAILYEEEPAPPAPTVTVKVPVGKKTEDK